MFADVDRELVATLSRDGKYSVVHRSLSGGEERIEVGPVRAVPADIPGERDKILQRGSFIATSVGATVLPRILPLLTAEAVRRVAKGIHPFNLILAENVHGAGVVVRGAMSEAVRIRIDLVVSNTAVPDFGFA